MNRTISVITNSGQETFRMLKLTTNFKHKASNQAVGNISLTPIDDES